ncbi:NUDIX domain-containing protein [Candidatus Nitrosocosmicus agrestis]|uniref:NUDIX domain-containing protein n=1 Tax=Candidatus Nitrosocosmicus agrestis TaxID=2563600 RepID=UPI00122E358A|nr:NUDIX hydrolase [Candidatus Nitrosocosmicus sp. SS]KAA2281114.1 NUDIX hydrolase [Candidatus Nitrosocosmicus sp. SS]KAF0869414.1 NUDIX hydrolase [Candidatus Nitrosocosmicus sp. SS]
MDTKVYKNPTPTTDVIITREEEILVVKRKRNPFKDELAIPGGFVNENETVEQAAVREIMEETALPIRLREILGVYSDPKRDPRKHIITTVFIGEIIGNKKIEPVAGDDASAIKWISIGSISDFKFAFDHKRILNDFVRWKHMRGTYWSTKDPA